MKPFFFFSLIMLLKSVLTWLVISKGNWSWAPLLTEIPFVWMLFGLIEMLATKRKLAWYMTVNVTLTAVFFAVIMYYKYYGVIVTYHALKMIGQVTAVKSSVFSLMHPYYLFIFLDIVVLSMLLIRSKKQNPNMQLFALVHNRKAATFLFAVSLAICLFNIMPNRASMSEFKQAEEMGILGYEAYTLLTKQERQAASGPPVVQADIDALKRTFVPEAPEYAGVASHRNVIVIQLESFQNFLIGLQVGGAEVTPVLNGLAREHLYFSNFYQQVGPGNTSDAEFVVNTSLYIPPQEAATQRYAGKELPSLPKLMKQHGYSSLTFHTNDASFWNRRELYRSLGFDRYYDRAFFGEDDPVFFGSSDDVLYDKTARELARVQEEEDKPFYAQVISMTAHHPYTIPPDKRKFPLPDVYKDTFVGNYILAQHYADAALGRFIDKLQSSGIWENSLIVVYGDHLGLPVYMLTRGEKELMNGLLGREYTYPDMLNIPLVVAAPGITQPAVLDKLGGQVDLLPTIASLTGIPLQDQIYFGQDLLNQTGNLLPQRYYLPSGSFMNEETIFIPGSGYDDGSLYPFAKIGLPDPSATEDEYERALMLLRLSDHYVMQLPDLDGEPE
jgi:phosphoglycerol transferase MdoB-like AlkP superfamily enzyme